MPRCSVVPGSGTQTSSLLQPMFDAWARDAGVTLFPGTAYLCAEAAVVLPPRAISLVPYEALHAVPFRRAQMGYGPRLYPISLGGAVPAWIYRWSHDDVLLRFLGPLSDRPATHLLEVVAPISIKAGLGLGHLDVTFVGTGNLTDE